MSTSRVAERLGHDLERLLATYAPVVPRDDDRVRGFVDAKLGGSSEDVLVRCPRTFVGVAASQRRSPQGPTTKEVWCTLEEEDAARDAIWPSERREGSWSGH